MPADTARTVAKVPRRRFLVAAGAAGAATVAAPEISRAQTVNWRMQSAWSARDVLHELAEDYAKRVAAMSGGRLRLQMLAGGSVVPPFQIADAIHTGILDGGHTTADFWYSKHRAGALFGTPPSFGWDSQGFLAWFHHGGGEALYRELINGILKLNVTGLLYGPLQTHPLGWFRRPIMSGSDFRGLKFRSGGLAGELYRALGAAVTMLPDSDLVGTMERGLLDATDAANPTTDLQLGLHEVAKVYMLGSHHRQAGALELIFNKTKFDALPAELRSILREAALAASSDQLWASYARRAKDLDEIRRRGVNVVRTGSKVLEDELKAWDRVIAEHSKDPFFAKVIASQKAWVKRTGPYLQANNLDSDALAAAYRHFFG